MILFFDTETTGLPINWNADSSDLDNWPRLIQLAYLVYDYEGNLVYSSTEIIRPSSFEIPKEASNVHGITTEIALKKGIKINDALEIFNYHVKRCNVIVAHNLGFDEKVIGAELLRLGYGDILKDKETVCTMLTTVNICKLPGHNGYKWPKLQELHFFLFGSYFTGEHDALSDVKATAKCFWELIKNNQLFVNHISKRPKVNNINNDSNIWESWSESWNTTYKKEINQPVVVFNDKSNKSIFLSNDQNYFATISKQWGVLKEIKLGKIKGIKHRKIASYENISCIINENNIWIIGAHTEIIHHRCLHEDMAIELIKIESMDENNIVIRYMGDQDWGNWEGGVLIFNMYQKDIIYYYNLTDNSVCKDRYKHISEIKDIDVFGQVQIFLKQYHSWKIIGFQLFSIYSEQLKDSSTVQYYLEQKNLFSDNVKVGKIQLLAITSETKLISVTISNRTSITFIFENKLYHVNPNLNHHQEFDFSSFGNYRGKHKTSRNTYLILEKNSITSLLALRYGEKNYTVAWFKKDINDNFFIHPDYSIIIAQNRSNQGLLIDEQTGDLLYTFDTDQSEIIDVSFVKRTYKRKGAKVQKGQSNRSPNIFKMEDSGWGKDKVIFLKKNNYIRTIFNKLLEDLITETKKINDEYIPGDLPF